LTLAEGVAILRRVRAPRGALLLLGLGLLGLAAHAALAWTAPWRDAAPLYRALVACAAAASALAALLPAGALTARSASAIVLAVSAAMHAVWIPVVPSLSDDVERYVFEGRLLRRGISPYAAPPAERQRALALATDEAAGPGHPELSTIYPPLSLLAFALGERLGGARGIKLLFGGASLAAAGLVVLWLARRGLSPARAALYAWAPLPALEFAGQGHHDGLGIALLALAALWLAGRARASAAVWGLAAAVKGASLVTLPFFWPAWPGRARGIAVGLAALGLLPLVWLSAAEHSGWRAYLLRWSHNAPLYTLLANWLESEWAIRGLLAGLLAAGLWALARARLDLPAGAAAATALALALSPTVHPWYAAWGLLWAPLAGSWALWALAQTVLWCYAPPGGPATPGHAPVPSAWMALEWGIPLGVGLVELLRRRAARDGRWRMGGGALPGR
jgi:hypothetical protein